MTFNVANPAINIITPSPAILNGPTTATSTFTVTLGAAPLKSGAVQVTCSPSPTTAVIGSITTTGSAPAVMSFTNTDYATPRTLTMNPAGAAVPGSASISCRVSSAAGVGGYTGLETATRPVTLALPGIIPQAQAMFGTALSSNVVPIRLRAAPADAAEVTVLCVTASPSTDATIVGDGRLRFTNSDFSTSKLLTVTVLVSVGNVLIDCYAESSVGGYSPQLTPAMPRVTMTISLASVILSPATLEAPTTGRPALEVTLGSAPRSGETTRVACDASPATYGVVKMPQLLSYIEYDYNTFNVPRVITLEPPTAGPYVIPSSTSFVLHLQGHLGHERRLHGGRDHLRLGHSSQGRRRHHHPAARRLCGPGVRAHPGEPVHRPGAQRAQHLDLYAHRGAHGGPRGLQPSVRDRHRVRLAEPDRAPRHRGPAVLHHRPQAHGPWPREMKKISVLFFFL
jgi:hypothetical protein